MPTASAAYSVEYTKVQASRKADPGPWADETRSDTYEAAGGTALVVHFFPIHPGEIIKGGQVYWDALGASTSITVGTTDSTARFMSSAPTVSSSSNGVVGSAGAPTGFFNAVDGINYENTTSADVDLCVVTSDAAVTGTIHVVARISRRATG